MIEAKQTHCGQYKPYGDFFRIWNVQTDLPQDEVVKWCFEKLYHGKVLPIHAEWRANICAARRRPYQMPSENSGVNHIRSGSPAGSRPFLS